MRQPYKRKEEFNYGTFYLGDARELIKMLPNESVDLILTDPPYGLGMDEFDNPNVFFELEDEMWRVLKKDAWLIFFYSIQKLPNAFKLKRFEYDWQIITYFLGSLSKIHIGDSNYECILLFRKGKPKVYYRRYDLIPAGELPFARDKPRNPLFKSTYVISILLQMFSNENHLVLDPFAGFGSVPLVAEFSKRRWIAFEIDENKFNIATEFIREGRVSKIIVNEKQKSKFSTLNKYF